MEPLAIPVFEAACIKVNFHVSDRPPARGKAVDFQRRKIMTQGDKSAYTDKQKRQAKHIEEGYEKRGVSEPEAKRRAWATENKVSGGGQKSGSGQHHKKS
jgi:hypothetical protein